MALQRPSSSNGRTKGDVAPLSTKVLVQLHCFSYFYTFCSTGSSCVDCKAADAASRSLGSAQATSVQRLIEQPAHYPLLIMGLLPP